MKEIWMKICRTAREISGVSQGTLNSNLLSYKTIQGPPAILLSEQIWCGGGSCWDNLIFIPWRVSRLLSDFSMKESKTEV